MNVGAGVVVNAGAGVVNAGAGGCVNDGADGWPSVDAGAVHHHPAGCGVTGLLRRNGCSMPKPCRHVGSGMLDLLQHAPFSPPESYFFTTTGGTTPPKQSLLAHSGGTTPPKIHVTASIGGWIFHL